ncbi:MAG: hypothetical protein QXD13_01220 [Candidatus Pacearchaeota archaeon]
MEQERVRQMVKNDDYFEHEEELRNGFYKENKESKRLRHLSTREQNKLREEFYRLTGRY